MADQQRLDFSFFRPHGEQMRRETRLIRTVLAGWAALSFGLPLLIWLAGLGDSSGLGRSFLTEARLGGFPLHYWLLAQGCTGGFIVLCKLYCSLWQRRLAHRPRLDAGSDADVA